MIVTTIQLTGEVKGYLDIKDGKAVPVIYSSSDIRDLSSKKGNTSRNIQLADTKNNHELLGYYFDVNTEAGTFDINKITDCILLQNGVPILDNAVLQLTAVKKNGVNNNYTQRVEYDVIIKDKTADFFTKLGGKELTDLKFNEFDHEYNASNVISSFSNTIADGYKYLLPYGPDSAYNLEEFKPAIYAKLYFDRIFETNGFSYEWDDLTDNETRFDKLVIPFNGDEKQINDNVTESVKVEVDNDNVVQDITEIFTTYGYYETVTANNEIQDNQNFYDNTVSKYNSNYNVVSPNTLKYTIEIDFEVVLDNKEASEIYLPIAHEFGMLPKLYVMNGAGAVRGEGKVIPTVVEDSKASIDSDGFTLLDTDVDFLTGETLLTSGNILLEIEATGINYLEGLYLKGNTKIESTSALLRRTDDGTAEVGYIFRINYIDIKIVPNVEGIIYNMPVYINDYIPRKIKQSDFIKSIFTMYNLFAEVDQFNSSKLILKKRDKYYDEGKERDWTAKLDKSKEQIITFLPSLQSKRLRLTYKQDSDEANAGYFDNTGEIYGQVEYIFRNEFVKDVEQKELIFSPTPIAETEFKAVTPIINGRTPKNNIRILYDGGEWDCQEYTILNYVGATPTTVNTYPSLSHFDRPYNPTFDINFAVCDYYFYSTLGTKTNNTLYNLNWRRTVGQIDSGKMLTAYFNLNEADISSLRLSDRVFILESWWNINRLEYDANSNNTTKAELISVDSEQKFARFKTGRPFKPNEGGIILEQAKDIFKKIFKSNNINKSLSSIDIQGKNNVIGKEVKSGAIYGNSNIVNSEKALVIGDGFNVNVSGLYVSKIFLSDEISLDIHSAGNIGSYNQTLTAFRTVDINGNGLYFFNGGSGFDSTATGETALSVIANNTGTSVAALVVENVDPTGDAIVVNTGKMRFASIPTYADEAAASSLETGTLYKTTTGEIRIKL